MRLRSYIVHNQCGTQDIVEMVRVCCVVYVTLPLEQFGQCAKQTIEAESKRRKNQHQQANKFNRIALTRTLHMRSSLSISPHLVCAHRWREYAFVCFFAFVRCFPIGLF